MTPKKLWYALGAVLILSFAVLGFFGIEIFRSMPPFPTKVVTTDGKVLFEGQDVKMFGNLLEDKLSGVFGDMVHTLHQTGMQTIYIASLC